MEELRHLDEVGYVRFASVYRSFQDIEAFRTEIDLLRRHRRRSSRARINCRCCRAMNPAMPANEPTAEGADRDGSDRSYMARALELAARGLNTTDPNPRVGCVLVRGGETLGEGWHERAGEAHAEVAALRAARGDVRGATAYVTLEPCSHTGRTPPCVDSADRRRHRPRGMRLGRSQSARRRRGHRAPEGRRHRGLCRSSGERGARPQPRFFFALRARPAVCAPEACDEPGWAHCARRRAERSGSAARLARRCAALARAQLRGADRRRNGAERRSAPRRALAYGLGCRQPLRVVLDRRLSAALPERARSSRARARWCSHPRRRSPPAAARLAAHRRPSAVERVPAVGARAGSRGRASRDWRGLEVNELLVECGPRLAGGLPRGGAGRRADHLCRAAAARRGCGAADGACRSGCAGARPLLSIFMRRGAVRCGREAHPRAAPHGWSAWRPKGA